MNVIRYHPLLVALHWLVAFGVVGGLVFGGLVLEDMPNDAAKLQPLAAHMLVGMTIGVLMLLRLVTRFTTQRPPRALTGNRLLDALSRVSHFLMYVLVLCMVSTGLGVAAMAGLFDIVLAGSGQPLPADFHEFPPHAGHGLFASLLAALLLLHIAGALYHQFVLKDGLFRRMWFGRRH